MESYAKFYHLYRGALFRFIRLSLVIVLIAFAAVEYISGSPPTISLVFFLFFIMFEIFVRFKIGKVKPLVTLLQNNGKNPLTSFTFPALEAIFAYDEPSRIVGELLTREQVRFILQRCNVAQGELAFIDVPKTEFVQTAVALAKNMEGKFVTTMDIFAAYLTMTEQETKILLNKDLKQEDLLHILYWARFDYKQEEEPKPFKVEFLGEGIGESWVYGWTIETRKFTSDITPRILGEEPVVIGRKKEHQAVVETLMKKEKSNVLLIGEAGSGKTTLIENIAYESFVGELPGQFYHKRFLELMVGALVAGVSNQGDLQSRVQEMLEEVSHAGNIILFIPELQDITGSPSFNLDLSETLLPYLREGKLRIVATASQNSFKTFIESKKTLLDFFEVVSLEEPNSAIAVQMLLEKASHIEKKYRVSLTYKAIVAAVNLANLYMQDRLLPGSAVVLLTETANKVLLTGGKVVDEKAVTKEIEEKTNVAVGKPEAKEKELLLHLEEKMHERIIDQQEAIALVAQAMRRLRTGLTQPSKPVSFLFLGPTGVGKTETAKTLAAIYFGGEENMIRLDMSEYLTDDAVLRLLGSVPGQGDEKGELTEKIHDHPSSLILLDEFEKAHPKILDLFLQVLSDGRLTDNKGKTVSFINTIIIATSNAGAEFVREEVAKGTVIDGAFKQQLLEFLQTRKIFNPELLNRFDDIVVFKPLEERQATEITKIMLKKLTQKLSEQEINLVFDDKIIAKIVKDGFHQQFGARQVRRYIQDNIEDLLSQKMLRDEVKKGSKVTFSTDAASGITINVT